MQKYSRIFFHFRVMQGIILMTIAALFAVLFIAVVRLSDRVERLEARLSIQGEGLDALGVRLDTLRSDFYFSDVEPITSIQFAGQTYVFDAITSVDLAITVAKFMNYRHWLYEMNIRMKRFGFLREVLKKSGVHEDYFILAVVESFLRPFARSRKRATGLWQFLYATAKEKGLVMNYYQDERRNPVKSTQAASKHLKKLLKKYDDNLLLVFAAYNWGSRNLDKIMYPKSKEYVVGLPSKPSETSNYVLQIFALTYILKYERAFFERFDAGVAYKLPASQMVEVVLYKELRVENLLAFFNNSFRIFEVLNPEYYRYKLPAGKNIIIRVPDKHLESFLEFIKKKSRSYSLVAVKADKKG